MEIKTLLLLRAFRRCAFQSTVTNVHSRYNEEDVQFQIEKQIRATSRIPGVSFEILPSPSPAAGNWES